MIKASSDAINKTCDIVQRDYSQEELWLKLENTLISRFFRFLSRLTKNPYKETAPIFSDDTLALVVVNNGTFWGDEKFSSLLVDDIMKSILHGDFKEECVAIKKAIKKTQKFKFNIIAHYDHGVG